mmetsp:Transcript_31395/g.90064  ORF Transcript_31395/g.90064 Transcript_31395/m.90064 type:complete len:211 (-) Transcript_31395:1584-2216(-)
MAALGCAGHLDPDADPAHRGDLPTIPGVARVVGGCLEPAHHQLGRRHQGLQQPRPRHGRRALRRGPRRRPGGRHRAHGEGVPRRALLAEGGPCPILHICLLHVLLHELHSTYGPGDAYPPRLGSQPRLCALAVPDAHGLRGADGQLHDPHGRVHAPDDQRHARAGHGRVLRLLRARAAGASHWRRRPDLHLHHRHEAASGPTGRPLPYAT